MDKAGGRKLAQCECRKRGGLYPPRDSREHVGTCSTAANTASVRLLTGDMTVKHAVDIPTFCAAVLGLSTKRDWAYIWFFFVFGLASSKPTSRPDLYFREDPALKSFMPLARDDRHAVNLVLMPGGIDSNAPAARLPRLCPLHSLGYGFFGAGKGILFHGDQCFIRRSQTRMQGGSPRPVALAVLAQGIDQPLGVAHLLPSLRGQCGIFHRAQSCKELGAQATNISRQYGFMRGVYALALIVCLGVVAGGLNGGQRKDRPGPHEGGQGQNHNDC